MPPPASFQQTGEPPPLRCSLLAWESPTPRTPRRTFPASVEVKNAGEPVEAGRQTGRKRRAEGRLTFRQEKNPAKGGTANRGENRDPGRSSSRNPRLPPASPTEPETK